MNDHEIKHGYHKHFDKPKDIRRHKEKAAEKQLNVNEVLKLAELHGLSYGVTVARLRDGRL